MKRMMQRYRYARVRCLCGAVNNQVPRGGKKVPCSVCGSKLYTLPDQNGIDEIPYVEPVGEVDVQYLTPRIVGYTN